MAILSQINQASAFAGTAIDVASNLLPGRVTLEDPESGVSISIDSTQSMGLTMGVDITEKPVAPFNDQIGGAVVDYVSRRSIPLIIDGMLSNYTVDLINSPVSALTSVAGSQAPGVSSAIQSAAGTVGKFVDLGRDEIDQKVAILYEWQSLALPVLVTGLRLDINRLTSDREFLYFIEEIETENSTDTGGGVSISITLKSLLSLSSEKKGVKKGNPIFEKGIQGLNIVTGRSNPFL